MTMRPCSMGGEVTTAEIEAYKGDFAGAMPYCGVLAGNNLFNYYLGDNVTAAGLTGTTMELSDDACGPRGVRARVPVDGGVRVARARDHLRRGDRRTLVCDRPHQDRDALVRHRRAAVRRYPLLVSRVPSTTGTASGSPSLTQVPFLFGVYPGDQRRHPRLRQRQRGR